MINKDKYAPTTASSPISKPPFHYGFEKGEANVRNKMMIHRNIIISVAITLAFAGCVSLQQRIKGHSDEPEDWAGIRLMQTMSNQLYSVCGDIIEDYRVMGWALNVTHNEKSYQKPSVWEEVVILAKGEKGNCALWHFRRMLNYHCGLSLWDYSAEAKTYTQIYPAKPSREEVETFINASDFGRMWKTGYFKRIARYDVSDNWLPYTR